MHWLNVLFHSSAFAAVVVRASPIAEHQSGFDSVVPSTSKNEPILVPDGLHEARSSSNVVAESRPYGFEELWSRTVDAVLNIGRRQDGTVTVAQNNAATTSTAFATSTPGTWKNNCVWNIAGVGDFTSRLYVSKDSWNSANFDNSTADSRYFVKVKSPTAQSLPNSDPSRIVVNSLGELRLQDLGMANTTVSDVYSPGAMITTAWQDIKYGSVRTVAKGTTNPGSVYGMYFYSPDPAYHGETDIELRTTYPTQPAYSNQQSLPDQSNPDTTVFSNLSSGKISDYHEYRLDWVPGSTTFYIDGTKVASITTYVPNTSGYWAWNAWSKSNSQWGWGLNTQDNAMYIQSIDLYVNRTSVSKCGTNPY